MYNKQTEVKCTNCGEPMILHRFDPARNDGEDQIYVILKCTECGRHLITFIYIDMMLVEDNAEVL